MRDGYEYGVGEAEGESDAANNQRPDDSWDLAHFPFDSEVKYFHFNDQLDEYLGEKVDSQNRCGFPKAACKHGARPEHGLRTEPNYE